MATMEYNVHLIQPKPPPIALFKQDIPFSYASMIITFFKSKQLPQK